MGKMTYILLVLFFSMKGYTFEKKVNKLLTDKEHTVFSKIINNFYMHPNPGERYMLKGDPVEYLFGMVHRNLNRLYKKCGRYPTEKEMPKALFKGEIKKLNCKIDGSLPDWKHHGSIRYKNFDDFPLGRMSFEEKRFKYFSNSKKFIISYKAPDDFIERGKRASSLFKYEYYSGGYLSSVKGEIVGQRIERVSEVVSYCELDKKKFAKSLCYIDKRKIIQYKEFD